MIIKRDFYLNQIIDKKENGRIKIITGIRSVRKIIFIIQFLSWLPT